MTARDHRGPDDKGGGATFGQFATAQVNGTTVESVITTTGSDALTFVSSLRLNGLGGVVTGPARVIGGPSDFGAFTPGDILVAEITTPAYTPLFAVAGGVVTDIGGVLSHGSIVAREYGIPAVLGTGVATHRIASGEIITVDGGRGEVRLEGAEAAAEGRPWVPWVVAGAAVTAGVIWLARRRRR